MVKCVSVAVLASGALCLRADDQAAAKSTPTPTAGGARAPSEGCDSAVLNYLSAAYTVSALGMGDPVLPPSVQTISIRSFWSRTTRWTTIAFWLKAVA